MSLWQPVKKSSSGVFPAGLFLASLVGLLSGLLAGCVTTESYHFNGQVYPNRESMLQAQKVVLDSGVNTVKPSPVVLSDKTLVIVLPSQDLFVTLGRRRFKYLKAGIYTESELAQTEGNLLSSFVLYNSLAESVIRAKLFKSVRRVTQNNLEDPVPQATRETAVLWFVQPKPEGVGVAQWFYVDDKVGKQVLPYDSISWATGAIHTNFTDAVRLMAIGQ